MKKLLLKLSLLALIGQASAMANREICSPQNADLSQTDFFSSTCVWTDLQPNDDPNPMITINGGKTVYAVCDFFGSDSIALVQGNKHARMKPLVAPGNHFDFVIEYNEHGSSSDDNQNILFYLNTRHPSPDDMLMCEFYS